MKYKVMIFTYIITLLSAGMITAQSIYEFKYYNVNILIDTNDFQIDKENKLIVNLNDSLISQISRCFNRYQFDNYMIVDFIAEVSEFLSTKANVSSEILKFNLLMKFDFAFILLNYNREYIVGIKTDMPISDRIIFNNNKYYVKETKNLHLFTVTYTNFGKNTLSIYREPEVDIFSPTCDTVKNINIIYKNTPHIVSLFFNTQCIEFINKIPFSFLYTDSIFMFPKPNSMTLENINKIKKIIDTFPEFEKINFIFSLCQQIEYIDDLKLYGTEKISLPNLTLFLNTSDCEDKSLLFSFLLWHILDIKSIIILYHESKHANVGIKYKINYCNYDTKYIITKKEQYLICEPSSMTGFNIGEENSHFSYSSPHFIYPIFSQK